MPKSVTSNAISVDQLQRKRQFRSLRLLASDPRGMPTIILFPRGSAAVSKSYTEALLRHVLYLEAFGRQARFVLRGHANLRTDEPGAVALSNRRAKAVADALQGMGVARSRIRTLASGSATDWDLQMGGNRPLKWNRRVEISIVLAGATTPAPTRSKAR